MQNDDFFNPNLYKREELRLYRRIFSGTIKETFLISVLKQVESDRRYVQAFLQRFNPQTAFSIESSVLGKNFSTINICKMIVMSHYSNTFSVSESEKGKRQDSREYIGDLVSDVVKMFEIEKIAASNYSISSLETYLPLIYYVSALNNYCGNKYSEFAEQGVKVQKRYNNLFNTNMLYKIIVRIRACVSLVDVGASDELMITFRTLAELFMTYVALWDQQETIINKYREFDQLTFDLNQGKAIPLDIKNIAKSKKTDPVKFCNYGWIENLKEFQELPEKKKGYSLGTLAEMLDLKYGEGFGTQLYRLYKACNPQTHGTVLFMNYFELELHVFINVAVMLRMVCEIMSEKLYSFKCITGNVDLIKELDFVLDKSKATYDCLQQYDGLREQTNEDYKNRYICSLKMKA